MKLGIATENGKVSGHFGRCSLYTFVEIENNSVIKKEEKTPPEHQIGSFPNFLKENNADYVLAGGMGPKAIELFEQFSIKPILGVSGTIDEIVDKFINGELVEGESSCDHDDNSHEHHNCH